MPFWTKRYNRINKTHVFLGIQVLWQRRKFSDQILSHKKFVDSFFKFITFSFKIIPWSLTINITLFTTKLAKAYSISAKYRKSTGHHAFALTSLFWIRAGFYRLVLNKLLNVCKRKNVFSVLIYCLRGRSLVVSDLHSEIKGSQLVSGCQQCAEVSFSQYLPG